MRQIGKYILPLPLALVIAAFMPAQVSKAVQPTYDASAVAGLLDLYNGMTEATKSIQEVGAKVQEGIDATGLARIIQYPTLNFEKWERAFQNGLECLVPDVSGLGVFFQELEINPANLCKVQDELQRKLSNDKNSEEYKALSEREKILVNSKITKDKELAAFNAAKDGLAVVIKLNDSLEDTDKTISEISTASKTAADQQQRLEINNRLLELMVRQQHQTNVILVQMLQVISLDSLQALPPVLAHPQEKKTNNQAGGNQ